MDPEAVLDVGGKPLIVRIHEGSLEPPPPAADGDFKSALSRAIDSMYRSVVVEARGLNGRGDRDRAALLTSAIRSAASALGCEKPLCLPPSSASGTLSCLFRAYYEDFQEFASKFLQELERELAHMREGARGRAFGLFRRGGR